MLIRGKTLKGDSVDVAALGGTKKNALQVHVLRSDISFNPGWGLRKDWSRGQGLWVKVWFGLIIISVLVL